MTKFYEQYVDEALPVGETEALDVAFVVQAVYDRAETLLWTIRAARVTRKKELSVGGLARRAEYGALTLAQNMVRLGAQHELPVEERVTPEEVAEVVSWHAVVSKASAIIDVETELGTLCQELSDRRASVATWAKRRGGDVEKVANRVCSAITNVTDRMETWVRHGNSTKRKSR